VVNVETQNFELVSDGKGNQFNLLRSISAQQTLNAAGRDFALQRTVQYSEYVINAPQFSDALAAEHNSQNPMYRDTDNGLRELRKHGSERVLAENSQKRIKAAVIGAMYQGTFNFPIPIAGISIADFDYRHTGAQLSTFFAVPSGSGFGALRDSRREPHLHRQHGRYGRRDMDLAAGCWSASLLAGHYASQPDSFRVFGI
jgi:uncharacterized protein YciI